MRKENSPLVSFFENLTIIVIFFGVLQTVLEDAAVCAGFSASTVAYVRLSGLFFDVYFTIEFFIRIFSSFSRGKAVRYFFFRNGWVDLLSSIPLLLFVSGPFALSYFLSVSRAQSEALRVLSVLKIVKGIRITRVLRFLRVLKVFGKIKNVQSEMAQRHVTTVCTIAVFSMVAFFLGEAAVSEYRAAADGFQRREEMTASLIQEAVSRYPGEAAFPLVRSVAEASHSILFVGSRDSSLFESPLLSSAEYAHHIALNDHYVASYKDGDLVILFDRTDAVVEESRSNLRMFFLILAVLLALVILYARNFAQTVTDPIYVMRRGFDERDYVLAVKVPARYAEEDVFRLAESYNGRWIPAKLRKLEEMSGKKSMLSLDDVLKNT